MSTGRVGPILPVEGNRDAVESSLRAFEQHGIATPDRCGGGRHTGPGVSAASQRPRVRPQAGRVRGLRGGQAARSLLARDQQPNTVQGGVNASTFLRLLVVEDRPDDADLMVLVLVAAGYEINACRVDTEASTVRALEEAEFDLVLSDWSLPGFDVESALAIVRAAAPDLPFVVVSGLIGEAAAFRLVQAGADAFVSKDQLADLPFAVERSLAAAAERKRGREQALQNDVRRYELMHEHSTDVIALCGQDGVPSYSSVPAGSGLHLLDLIDPREESVEAHLARAAFRRAVQRPGVSSPVELRALHEDGSEHWWEVVWSNHLSEPLLAGLVLNARDITERRHAEGVLRHKALHDELTGLPNRGLLFEHLTQGFARQARDGGFVAVILLDLDGFKGVNDEYGHLVGDRVLAQIGQRLDAQARQSEMVARFGGDEFVAVCEGVSSADVVALVARLVRAAGEFCEVDGLKVAMSASAGYSISRGNGHGARELIREADIAAYRAKRAGGNRYEAFDDKIQVEEELKRALTADLRRGFQEREFVVHYQPQVDLITSRIEGVEALVRWNHPERGLLLPDEFIHVAEESGLIEVLGWLVLEQAAREMASWPSDMGLLRMAVNLAARQLDDPALPGRVEALLQDTGVAPSRLCLEITETAVIHPGGAALAVLEGLAGLGVKLAIDDFGTGYASLHYLQRLPVQIVKVDRSFVTGMVGHSGNQAIVRAVVSMAREFALEVVAEGVETPEEARLLRDLGCQSAQGFLYAKAGPIADIWPLLGTRLDVTSDAWTPGVADEPVEVLLVEDDPEDASLIERALHNAGLDCRLRRVETESEYLRALLYRPHVILADFQLPTFSAVRALEGLRLSGADVPFILVSGSLTDELALSLVRRGACNYLSKDRLASLGAVVRTALADHRLRVQGRAGVLEGQRTQGLLEALIGTAPTAMWVKDLRGCYLLANPAFHELFGVEPGAALGATDQELMPPELAARLAEEDRLTLSTDTFRLSEGALPASLTGSWTSLRFPVRDARQTVIGTGGIVSRLPARSEAPPEGARIDRGVSALLPLQAGSSAERGASAKGP